MSAVTAGTAAAGTVAHEPEGLAIVEELVNSLDVESGQDELSGPDGARAWLAARGLLHADAQVDEGDAAALRSFREAVRALALANNGLPAIPDAALALETASSRGQLRIRLAADGTTSLEAEAPGVAGALGRLAAVIHDASIDGSWRRFKACREPSCHWAFYDASRNRSGVWCDMAVCGNRTKVRAYRRRHAGDG
jgi:predicted RNA-binding Zn ribbon-like protein